MIWHRKFIRATDEERRRIQEMLKLGCIACAHLKIPNGCFTQCHHIVEGNKRLGHLYTIPLCIGHHQGIWTWDLLEVIPEDKRVAISDGRKAFTKVYPTEREMWTRVQRRMDLPVVWPNSKVLPRLVAVT